MFIARPHAKKTTENKRIVKPKTRTEVVEQSYGALCWPKVSKNFGIDCCQVSHQNREFARLITEVQEMPKTLSKIAGTQQIHGEWFQLKKILFHNLHRKSKQSGDSDVNPRLKQRVW